MTKRQSRLVWVFSILLGAGLLVFLGLKAFNENLLYFYAPQDVLENKAPLDKSFRLGGMVVKNSVQREGLTTKFQITDTVHTLNVAYTGILPDLFREGQGIIATGKLLNNNFTASEVLAKHDENYMPPEVANAMARAKKAKYQAKYQTDKTLKNTPIAQ